MNVETFAPCVNYYTNVYDATNFLQMIEEEASESWARLEWERSTTIGDGVETDNAYRSSRTMSLRPIMTDEELVELKDVKNEFKKIFKSIDDCIWDYRNTYDLPLSGHEYISVLKYESNAEYRHHWDAGPGDAAFRVLSMVGFLNDGYTGGELVFPTFDVKVTPQAGSVILFPSAYPYAHSALPVTSGIKYSLVTWFMG